jgi:hypothetical protein
VFNLVGYALLFEYFIQRSDRQLVLRLDNHQYNDHELIEVKIPLHTPYLTSWSDYERIDGEAEVDGIYYTYVKRKIYNDTLYLLCLPNKNKTELNAARIEYGNKMQDVPASTKDTAIGKKYPAASEYQHPVVQFTIGLPATATGELVYHPIHPVLRPFITGPYHPPRV